MKHPNEAASDENHDRWAWGPRLILSVVMFGAAIGLMAGLSSQVGTTSTLIGLLITLVGSSLAPLIKPGDVTLGAAQREHTFYAAGLVSVGLVVGLGGAFVARWAEQAYWLPRQQAAYLQFVETMRAKGITLENVKIPAPDWGGQSSPFNLQVNAPSSAEGQPKSKARLESIDRVLGAPESRKTDPAGKERFQALLELRGYLSLSSQSHADRAKRLGEIAAAISNDASPDALRLKNELEEWRKELLAR